VTAAMQRGFDWMQAHQKANGSWSDENYPALTALGLWAFAGSGRADRTAVCDRAAAFIAGFVQEDGGIYKKPTGGRGSGGLSVYNTAVCMTALHAYDRQRFAAPILRARAFLAGAQIQGASAGTSTGGFGYERTPPPPPSRAEIEKRAKERARQEGQPEPSQADIDRFVAMMEKRAGVQRADLSNTGLALMAMRLTQDLEDQRASTEKRVDIDWSAALKFAGTLQNQDASDSANYGGFGYESSGDRGGVSTNRAGAAPALRGYGSMTYAGLESMLYAQVGREDPRVRSAIEWAVQHWSVTENPGQGSKGLFYYYTVMAKTLPLLGQGDLTSGSKVVSWRKDLTTQLLKMQQTDGSWANTDNTFWENDPALVTSYALLSLLKCRAQ
jgi:squalene-hopene/tetraprenyl-beta-curcumene cyclase